MICASIILLIGHLTIWIVYLTMLFCLIQLTCLNVGLINLATPRSYLWFQSRSFWNRKSELLSEISIVFFCILFWNIRCGHRGIRLRSSFHYVYVYVTLITRCGRTCIWRVQIKGARSAPSADGLVTGVAKARVVILYRRPVGARTDVMNIHVACRRTARSQKVDSCRKFPIVCW